MELWNQEQPVRSGFLHGRLNIGEVMAPPLIEKVCELIDDNDLVIMDAPPGANCSTGAVLSRADLVVLVAEPTPFGLNDVKIAAEMIKLLNKPFGVIVNRYGMGDDRVEKWCRDEDIPLWGQIPYSDAVAKLIAGGAEVDKIAAALGEPLTGAVSKLLEAIS